MDPRPFPKSTNGLASLLKETGTTLATQEVASFTHNGKANAERGLTFNKASGPTAGIMKDRPTLPRRPSSLRWLMKDLDFLDFLIFLYAEPQSQLTGLYAKVPQEIRMIREETAILPNKLVTLSQWMVNPDLTFDV